MCGIFGIYDHPEASRIAYLGLHALQHRGQESAGITTSDSARLYAHRGLGRVADAFDEQLLDSLVGRCAVGHVRYSTAGDLEPGVRNAQPITVRYGGGMISVAHNGTLTNAGELRRELEADGSIFSGSADTEVLVHRFARSREDGVEARLIDALRPVTGAWSLVVLTEDKLIGARDPHGVRPLVLGRLDDSWILASETSALHLIEAEYVRQVQPGEMVVIDADGVRSSRPFGTADRRACVFEHVYFSRPDSRVFGQPVYTVRRELGRRLAEESGVEADVVIPVPDSGQAAAIGYAEESGLPYEIGLVRSHYMGRTFIEPSQAIRHFGVKLKLSPVRGVLEGRRVVVVDDSLVRGTTSRKIVEMIRAAGAREVHMRVSSPPISHPCYYGIDTPSEAELIASNHDVDGIARLIGCDTLAYLSREGLLAAAGGAEAGFCDACFTGHYAIPTPAEPRVRAGR
jgi:amidophosphoribosyltransferase